MRAWQPGALLSDRRVLLRAAIEGELQRDERDAALLDEPGLDAARCLDLPDFTRGGGAGQRWPIDPCRSWSCARSAALAPPHCTSGIRVAI